MKLYCDKIALLHFQCTDKLERDRLILFLNKLILNKVSYSAFPPHIIHISISVFLLTDLFPPAEKCEGSDGL